jgi:hypothetical protein
VVKISEFTMKKVAAIDEVVQRYKTVTAVDSEGNITFG